MFCVQILDIKMTTIINIKLFPFKLIYDKIKT